MCQPPGHMPAGSRETCCFSRQALAGLQTLRSRVLKHVGSTSHNGGAAGICCRAVHPHGQHAVCSCGSNLAPHRMQVPHPHQAGCIPSCPSSSMAPPTTGSRAAAGQAIVSQTPSRACQRWRQASQSQAAQGRHSRAQGLHARQRRLPALGKCRKHSLSLWAGDS